MFVACKKEMVSVCFLFSVSMVLKYLNLSKGLSVLNMFGTGEVL